ncbi:MAG: threonine dehydratase [Planctomycetes bacterium]|nr:threonine dehydratase [Planctomycetota bacterium]NUQ33761.1 threonine dehydratase [Planctomycetaceae bacterium]
MPESELARLTLNDIRTAREVIARHLPPTPFFEFPRLSERTGTETWVKLENTQPIGAFKVRGGVNFVNSMSAAERALGFVAATRGNHGQALAYGCRASGAKCTIFVPQGNNPDKNAAMKAYGADLRIEGKDFDEALEAALRFSATSGAHFVHPADPAFVAGAGTMALEMLDQAKQPFDAIFIPVGAGSIVTGVSVVLKALSPKTKIIGVQAENAPAMYQTYKKGSLQSTSSANTIADGLAIRNAIKTTGELLQRSADDMVLVSEEEIRSAIRCYADTTHYLAEGAGAAALAGLIKLKDAYKGKRVAVILSGGNIDHATLTSVLCQ